MWFQNVRIIKNPLDLWMLQQIAYEVQPDFVIETGTWMGGSALYWAPHAQWDGPRKRACIDGGYPGLNPGRFLALSLEKVRGVHAW